MSAMNHVEEPLLRLGLVLAGGGSRIRRLVAEVSDGEPLGAGLSNSGLPPALLDTATKLARAEAKTTIERITTAGWQWLIPGDGQYPELLAATADPPLGLSCGGASRRGRRSQSSVRARQPHMASRLRACLVKSFERLDF